MNGDVGTFEPAKPEHATFGDFLAAYANSGASPKDLLREYDHIQRMTILKSEHYTVFVDKAAPHGLGKGADVWHLSIKRNDREPIMDWRDLQAIKNAVCGAEAEALQLFPAESRVVDEANQFHLFALMPNKPGRRFPMIPCGWTTGHRSETPIGKSKQRTREQQP